MFYNLFWRIKHHRFIKQWIDVVDTYRHHEYFKQILGLFEDIDPIDITDDYRENRRIESAYATLPDWLAASAKAREAIQYNRLTPQPTLKMYELTLSSFLMSGDYEITYLSALQSTQKELSELYRIIENLPSNGSKDYAYRQLKEIFLTGLNFYTTAIKEKIKNME